MTLLKTPQLSSDQALDMLNNYPVMKDLTRRSGSPVLAYDFEGEKYTVKFEGLRSADHYVLNSTLFRYMGMNFIPCQKITLGESGYPEHISRQLSSSNSNAIIVAPYIEGQELAPHFKNQSNELQSKTLGYQLALKHTPHVIAASHLHATPQNILFVDNKELVFLDARVSVMNFPIMKMDDRLKNVMHQETRDYIKLYSHNMQDDKEGMLAIEKDIVEYTECYGAKIRESFPDELAAAKGLKDSLLEKLDAMREMKIPEIFKPK